MGLLARGWHLGSRRVTSDAHKHTSVLTSILPQNIRASSLTNSVFAAFLALPYAIFGRRLQEDVFIGLVEVMQRRKVRK